MHVRYVRGRCRSIFGEGALEVMLNEHVWTLFTIASQKASKTQNCARLRGCQGNTDRTSAQFQRTDGVLEHFAILCDRQGSATRNKRTDAKAEEEQHDVL